MGFVEVQFPEGISYGSSGGPSFSTAVIEVDSGAEERIARWSTPRHRYNAKYGIKSWEDLATVKTFFIARLGAAYGFRYKDWSDFTSASDGRSAHTNLDQNIGTGNGSTKDFQLVKKYTSGGVTVTRSITKPVSGTVLVAVNGVAKTEGVDFTVNTVTGMVTFTVAPTAGHAVTAGYEYDVPVRFETSTDSLFDINIEDFSSGAVPDIGIVEIIDEGSLSDDYPYGGADEFDLSADITITELGGRALKITPTGNGYKVKLPPTTDLPLGGPYFFITNVSGTYTFIIATSAGVTIATLAVSSSGTVLLGVSGWYVI